MNLKVLIVLFVFILLIMMLAGGSLGGRDLTPDTPPASGDVMQTVISGVQSPAASGGQAVPVNPAAANSFCPVVYKVQAGDTMSAIAARCGVPLNALIAANPAVTNPNLIRVGQDLIIPVGQSVPQTQPQPQPQPTRAPTQAPPAGSAPQPTAEVVATAVPQAAPVLQGVSAGQKIVADFQNLPPNTFFNIGIGQTGGEYIRIGDGMSDDQGRMQVEVFIPLGAAPGESWTVTAYIATMPRTEYTYGPILIGQ